MRLSKWYVGALVGVCLLLASCSGKFGAGPVTPGTGSSSPAGPVIVEAQLQGSLPTTPTNTALVDAGITISSVTLIGSTGTCQNNQLGPSANVTLVSGATNIQFQNSVTQPVVVSNGTIPSGCYTGVQVAFSTPTETLVNNSGLILEVNGTPTTCGSGSPVPVGTTCTLTSTLDNQTVTITAPGGGFAVIPDGPLTLDLTINLAATINGGATATVAGFDWNPAATGAVNLLFPGPTPATSPTIVTSNNVVGIVTAIGTNNFTIAELNTENNAVTSASTLPEAGTTTLNIATVSNAGYNGCTTSSTLYSSSLPGCYSTFSGFNTGVTACTTAQTSSPQNLFPCVAVGQIVDVNYVYPEYNPTQAIAATGAATTTTPSGVTLVSASTPLPAADDIINAVQGTVISGPNTTSFTMVVTGYALSAAGSTTYSKLTIGEKLVVTPAVTATYGALNTGIAASCVGGGAPTFTGVPSTGPGQSVVIDITSLGTTPPIAAAADVVELVPAQFSANLLNVGGVVGAATAATSGTNPTLALSVIPSLTATGTVSWNAATLTTGGTGQLTTFTGNPTLSAGKLTFVNVQTPGDIATGTAATPNVVRIFGELYGTGAGCTVPTITALQVGQP